MTASVYLEKKKKTYLESFEQKSVGIWEISTQLVKILTVVNFLIFVCEQALAHDEFFQRLLLAF